MGLPHIQFLFTIQTPLPALYLLGIEEINVLFNNKRPFHLLIVVFIASYASLQYTHHSKNLRYICGTFLEPKSCYKARFLLIK